MSLIVTSRYLHTVTNFGFHCVLVPLEINTLRAPFSMAIIRLPESVDRYIRSSTTTGHIFQILVSPCQTRYHIDSDIFQLFNVVMLPHDIKALCGYLCAAPAISPIIHLRTDDR